MTVAGLLLAAGAGRRMGGPKALLRDPHGVPYLDRTVGLLLDGGCERVTVVLGASSADAVAVLDEAGWSADDAVDVVVADDWDEGMGASLRAGLRALGGGGADAALVTLVDLPDVDAPVLRRVLGSGSRAEALVRATYDGRPGHPVLIGRDHWAGVVATAEGDRGARTYFRSHQPVACECADLATGRDLDRPEDLE
ncbi:MAG: NTP transferase domain-containing protein [Nocardioidaceae bacterium]